MIEVVQEEDLSPEVTYFTNFSDCRIAYILGRNRPAFEVSEEDEKTE